MNNMYSLENLYKAIEDLNYERVKDQLNNGVIIDDYAIMNKEYTEAFNWNIDANIPLNKVCKLDTTETDKQYEIFKLIAEKCVYLPPYGPNFLMISCSSKRKNYNYKLIRFIIENFKSFINEPYNKQDQEFDSDFNGQTPLMELFSTSDCFTTIQIIKLLIKNGADINARDKFLNNSLMYINLSEINLIQLSSLTYEELLNNFNLTEQTKMDLEHNFMINPPTLFIKFLIQNDIDINNKNILGITPLMHFSSHNAIELVKHLVDNKVDLIIKSDTTAYDMTINNEIKNIINSARNNNPQRINKLLSNFTIDKPMKYTTHIWDFKLSEVYKNFDCFMKKLKNQFDTTSIEIKELSPNLYKKIYTFLFEQNPDEEYSWCYKVDINIGWSSLKGLKEHCDKGNKPESFVLPKTIIYQNQELTIFKEVIDLFKQEIEIRENFKNLETIFVKQKKNLGYGRNSIFKIDLSNAKLNRQFYTDVEKFESALDKIFLEIGTRRNCPKIEILTQELEDKSIELRITQLDSYSSRNAKELLQRANEKGDMFDIKKSLENLCDWSIESSFEDENFRVNILYSNNVKKIVPLTTKAKGFSHIFRFYK